MFPHPRIVPRLIRGQAPYFVGQVFLARDQISVFALFGQSVSICSMDSLSALQYVHLARCSYVVVLSVLG